MSVEVIDVLPATPARSNSNSALDKQQQWAHAIDRAQCEFRSPEPTSSENFSLDASPCLATPNHELASTPTSPPKSNKKHKQALAKARLPRKVNVRKSPARPKSPTVPTFHTKPGLKDTTLDPSSPVPDAPVTALAPPLIRAASYASTAETRSPAQKKPPASHSSYGVETSCGPPPSFTTQRTLSQDRLWKPNPPDKSDVVKKLPSSILENNIELSPNHIEQALEDGDPSSSCETLESPSVVTPRMEGSAGSNAFVSGFMATAYGLDMEDDGRDQTIRVLDLMGADDGRTVSSSEDRKSDDLFLNIARADPEWGDLIPRSERRKSKTPVPSFIPAAQAKTDGLNEQSPSSNSADWDSPLLPPGEEAREAEYTPKSVTRPSALSAHPLEGASRQRHLRSMSRATAPLTRSSPGSKEQDFSPDVCRKTSTQLSGADFGAHPYQKTSLSGIRHGRNASTSQATERHGFVEVNATESTASTTAPSTVWDELDDLKSRIRKLELTGKLPPSSAAAMSSVERPRTAATTNTTVSSSPKLGKDSMFQIDSAAVGISSTMHPLLHEALSKAKAIVNQDTYKKLEATALDALQLALLFGGENQTQSTPAERQARRRIDSMCRGLTELTIALSSEMRPSLASTTVRQSRRDVTPTSNYTPISEYTSRRRSSEVQMGSLAASRIESRLGSRRTSLFQDSNRRDYSSLNGTVYTPPSGQSRPLSTLSSRLSHPSALTQNRSTRGLADGAGDEENDSPVYRPISRAMTEMEGSRSTQRISTRVRTSFPREHGSPYSKATPPERFISSHRRSDTAALPSSAPRTSGLQSRRLHGSYPGVAGSSSSSAASPVTPRENSQPKYQQGVAVKKTYMPRVSAENSPDEVQLEEVARHRESSGRTASQIDSSVLSRLKAVKMERDGGGREPSDPPAPQAKTEATESRPED